MAISDIGNFFKLYGPPLSLIEKLNCLFCGGDFKQAFELSCRILDDVESVILQSKDIDNDIYNLLHSIAGIFSILGAHEKSIIAITNALAITFKWHPINVHLISEDIILISKLQIDKRRYEDAILNLEKALNLLSGHTEEEKLLIGKALHLLGVSYHHLCDSNAARQYFEYSWELLQVTLGKTDIFYPSALNSMATLHIEQKNFGKALELLMSARDIVKSYEVPRQVILPAIYNNIGQVYLEEKNHYRAELYFKKSIETYYNLNIINDEAFSTYLNNLAMLLAEHGSPDDSIKIQKQAVEYFSARSHNNPALLAMMQNNLGVFYLYCGDYQEGERLTKLAIRSIEKTLGPTNAKLIIAHNNIGGIYNLNHDWDKAIPYFNKAYTLSNSIYGKDHPSVIHILENMLWLMQIA